jgi:hypothetical protein
MNTDANELLKESIEASNRTTHAVRVLAKFLLIQLAATTAALVLYFLATISTDATEFPYIIAVTVLFAGTVWAIYAGWTELGLSADPLLPKPEAPSLVAVEESDGANWTPGKYFEQKKDSNKAD